MDKGIKKFKVNLESKNKNLSDKEFFDKCEDIRKDFHNKITALYEKSANSMFQNSCVDGFMPSDRISQILNIFSNEFTSLLRSCLSGYYLNGKINLKEFEIYVTKNMQRELETIILSARKHVKANKEEENKENNVLNVRPKK